MQRVTLGETTLSVSNLCLGTMQFGWTTDEPSSFAVLDAFVEAGGNFLDTADIYSNWAQGNAGGVAEEIIGRWMHDRGNRDSLVVATKVRGRMWDGADGEGLSRKHIERAVEDSLRRLQVDVIDLYQCHYPDDSTPIEETLTVFDELVKAGKVRNIGASNYDVHQLDAALTASTDKDLARFATLQPHYNLVHRREYEAELTQLCEDQLLGVIPYSPLAGGFLTGKYQRGQDVPKSQRADRAKRYMTGKGFAVIEAVERIASAHETTIAAVVLAWTLRKPAVTAPIIGANTPEQLAELLPAGDLVLSPAEVSDLDLASVSF
ncbi:MAG TPA: aldo/keto reductase [Dehalococcoidia bacterium]|nr:aldo/keto reductase [Dehalococcoidia bacterium]